MVRTILVVDDNEINRQLLTHTLSGEYQVLEARSGEIALDTLMRDPASVSAVLLDIVMQGIDGYEVLRQMRADKVLAQIPVIMVTAAEDEAARVKALSLGANDYILKPFNPEIVRHCLHNNIALRETAATVNALQRDRLTGLFVREVFFEKARAMIAAHEPGYYVMASFDIDGFKVVNDQYGTQKGDEILRHIARVFRACFDAHGGIVCRIAADDFGALFPASFKCSRQFQQMRADAAAAPGLVSPVALRVGLYHVDDVSMPPSAMYDRAMLAADSVKSQYDVKTAVYDESFRERLLREQRIVNEMASALENGQFETWYQPQYNHMTGALVGAEALARWRHPEKGLIAPGVFVPIFEKNGFIYSLDKYIWEDVCRFLRAEIDRGGAPIPVSVNISRIDIFHADIVDVITGLTQKYALPADLLRLEITESAFADSTKEIVEVVRQLIARGFTVEIDDFGSGYSSLNTLKSVPAQVLKLDMRFFEDEDCTGRSGNIIESVVRMAKWLGMSVIAEGVETIAQADFLKSIGCAYIQGYLYARPMPAQAYATLTAKADREEKLATMETAVHLDNSAFWEPKSMDTFIFNSFVGSALIFEYHNGNIQILRVNDKYTETFGKGVDIDSVFAINPMDYMDEANQKILSDGILRAIETGRESTCETCTVGLYGTQKPVYILSTARVIARADDRYLLYGTILDITSQREAEKNAHRMSEQMQAVLDNVHCGITAVVYNGAQVEYLMINDRYYEILGYTKEQYRQIETFSPIHPDDRADVVAASKRVYETGEPATIEYRAVKRDGSLLWMRVAMTMTRFAGVDKPVQLAIFDDITLEKQAALELLDNLPCGAALYTYDGETLSVVHRNKRYWELVGRPNVDRPGERAAAAVHPDDIAPIAQELKAASTQKRDAVFDARIRGAGGCHRLFHCVGRIAPRLDDRLAVSVTFTPVSDEAASIQETLLVALQAMMRFSSEVAFVKGKDLRYISCSRKFALLAGCKSEKELAGKTTFEVFPRELATRNDAVDRAILISGESYVDLDIPFPTQAGIRHLSFSKYPLLDSKGAVLGIFGTGPDITETRAMKSQLELLTDSIPGGLIAYEVTPPDTLRVIFFNDGVHQLFGMTRQEYADACASDALGRVFHEDRPQLDAQIRALLAHGAPITMHFRVHTRNGGYRFISPHCSLPERRGDQLFVNVALFDVTVQEQALERLRISEEENRLAMQLSGSVVGRYAIAERTLTISAEAATKFGRPEQIPDLPYGPVRAGKIASEHEKAYIDFFESIQRGEESGSLIYRSMGKNGWSWQEAHFVTIHDNMGQPVSAVMSFADVTERLDKEAAYRRWQQSLLDRNPDTYMVCCGNISKNTPFSSVEGRLLHVDYPDTLTTFDQQIAYYAAHRIDTEDRDRFLAFLCSDALLARFNRGQRTDAIEYRESTENGRGRWLKCTVELVEYPNSTDVEAYLMYEDIDSAKRAELHTIELAETDPLTGVLNRSTFITRVERLLKTAQSESMHALMMLDIDGFKLVNDVFGHRTGDTLLIDIADMLREILRRGDLLCRLGGDEFLIFLRDIPNETVAANKAKRICELTQKSLSPEIHISGSVGIAIAPIDGTDFESLYKNVDSAMYYVKGSGKNNYTFYREDMEDEQYALALGAKDALAEGNKDKKRRMLIVDDNKLDYEILANIFKDEYIVEKAKDGGTALIRLRHFGSAISVVLLDLMMPGMDGFAVLDKMQHSEELQSIPVIVVSGDEDHDTCLRAITSGATDFVTKPVDTGILRIRVRAAIAKSENAKRRAKSSFLQLQNNEVVRYKNVLENVGLCTIEHDWINSTFLYDTSVGKYLAGTFDERKLWHILLSDMVADTLTVQRMQRLAHDVAHDRTRTATSTLVRLKTPSGATHRFRMHVRKLVNEYKLTDKLILTLVDLDYTDPG